MASSSLSAVRARGPSARTLVAQLLDQPDLAERVQELPPRALGRIVDRVGLEDASELVALATPAQLVTVLDDDVWRSCAPGEDETFDAARFLTWLEVLLEAGERVAAEKLAGLPEDFLTLAFHKHLLVIELDRLAAEVRDEEEGEQVDKALSNHLHEELDEMVIVARGSEGWDAVLGAILALDREHHDLVVRVLGRCAGLTEGEIDDAGGLYDVLSNEDALEDDVAGEREDRRAAEGFVAPSSAKSFLTLARRPPADGPFVRDAITRAWQREAARAPVRVATAAPTPSRASALLAALGREEDVVVEPRVAGALPGGASTATHEPSADTLLGTAMRTLAADAPAAFAERSEELSYLANVLAAGAATDKRRMRPVEAVQAAIATVSLGLDLALGRAPASHAAETLASRPADELFRLAFHALHERVVGRAKSRIEELGDALEPDVRAELEALADDVPRRGGRRIASRAELVATEAWLASLAVGEPGRRAVSARGRDTRSVPNARKR